MLDPFFDGKCASCRFAVEQRTAFECHRHAPRPQQESDARFNKWPHVTASDWCGDHQPLTVSTPEDEAKNT